MNNALSSRALLISPIIHTFYNSRNDARMLDEVMTALPNVSPDDSVMRSLLPSDEFKNVNKAKQGVRKVINTFTFPWSDNARILPAADVFSFHEALNEATTAFGEAADELSDKYEALRNTMQQRRGDWFNPLEYPATKEDFRDRFRVELNLAPFPDVEDFRLEIPDDLVESIKAQLVNSQRDRTSALCETWMQSLHKTAMIWMEAPTQRRFKALKDLAERITSPAVLLLPEDDVVLGVCKYIKLLPQTSAAAAIMLA